MLWMAVGVLALAALAALILRIVARTAMVDLGSVSTQWIAQYRRDN
jgi:hypothetical protein